MIAKMIIIIMTISDPVVVVVRSIKTQMGEIRIISHRSILYFFRCRYKGTRELLENDKYEVFKEGNKHVLVVHDVFGEDADEYSVKASNRAGSRSSRADLSIKCTSTCVL